MPTFSSATSCELRESLLLHFVRGWPRYAANLLWRSWRTSGQSKELCPRMTAPVRPWPPELGKASGALGGQERVLSAVGQPDFLVRRQRGRRPGDPRLAILRSFARAFTAFTALTLSQTQWTKQCTHGGQLRAILCRRFGCCNSAADKELGERRTLGADTLNCPHGEKAL